MTIIRAFSIPATEAKSELLTHGYIDNAAAGGKVVLTTERVRIETPPIIPTKAGIVKAFGSEYLILSLVNNGIADIVWATPPKLRGTNIPDIDDPGYDDGYALPSAATIGTFGATLKAGEEQAIKAFPELVGFGAFLRAELAAVDSDLTVRVLRKV